MPLAPPRLRSQSNDRHDAPSGGTCLQWAGDQPTVTMILMPGVNDAPDSEDDSKTTTAKDAASDDVIEPNDNDPEGNDLTVSKADGKPIDSDDLSTMMLPSGAVVMSNTDGDTLYLRPKRHV